MPRAGVGSGSAAARGHPACGPADSKTGGINGWDGANGYDYVYFGSWVNDEAAAASPLKWRVLDTKSNRDGAREGGSLFLLSEELLGDGSALGGVYFNQHNDSPAWQNSDAQAWCKDFAGEEGTAVRDAFSLAERDAIQETSKNDGAYEVGTDGTLNFSASVNILDGDKAFFLSAEEVMNAVYGFTDDAARQAAGAGNGCQ